MLSREDGSIGNHFSQNAADGPNINFGKEGEKVKHIEGE